MSCWNCAASGEPKFWMDWEFVIARREIIDERSEGVGRCVVLLDDDCITFEETISFVRR